MATFYTSPSIHHVVTGSVYEEILVSYAGKENVGVRYRLYAGQQHVVVETSAGPLDLSGPRSKDVFVRFKAALNNNGVFYTDENGMEMKQRAMYWRPWAPVYSDPDFPVACNFYPMTTIASFGDAHAHLSILSSNSHSAGAMIDGAIDIMFHRLWFHDSKVEAPNTPITASFYLHLGPSSNFENQRRPLSCRLLNAPLFFAAPSLTALVPSGSLLAAPLPPELHLLSLQQIPVNLSEVLDNIQPSQPGVVLARFLHIFPKANSTHGVATISNISSLFKKMSPLKAEEYTIDGIRPMAEAQESRLLWLRQTGGTEREFEQAKVSLESVEHADWAGEAVTVANMEIRTFRLQLSTPGGD